MKKALKIIGVIVLILIILAFIAYICIRSFIDSKLNKINYVEIDESKLEIEEETKEQLGGYRNIALFGLDSRVQDIEETYSRGNRSDCIMILSVNESTKEAKLISVYRDTYVNIDGHGLDKINHAYSFGGPELALATLNKNLDLDIDEFVTVNFTAVASLVDAVGGIDVELTSEEVKYINGYIKGTSKNTGMEADLIKEPGLHHLNGVQAVAYGRIRYTSGGDAKRTERMRVVAQKAFTKFKDLDRKTMNKVVDDLLPQISTNISKDEIYKTIRNVKKYKVADSDGWPYYNEGAMLNKVWYGIPCTLESNVEELHKNLFPDVEYEVSDRVKDISENIEKVSGYGDRSKKK